MKKLLALLLCCTLAISLAACGGEDFSVESPAPTGSDLPPASESGSQPSDTTPEPTAPLDESTPPPTASQQAEPAANEMPSSQPPAQSEPTAENDEPAASAPGDKMTLEELWEKLAGCWTAADERFVYFTYGDNGPIFWSGQWESSIPYGREAAEVNPSLTYLGNGLYTLGVTYPPLADAADTQDLRPLVYTLMVDISGLEQDGKISVEAPEDQIRQYAWGGVSYDDAYDSTHQVQYATFDEVSALWSKLFGYWNSKDGASFLIFDAYDSHSLAFQAGLWESGGGMGYGSFSKAMSPISYAKGNAVKLVIYYRAIEDEDWIDGPRDPLYQVIYLELSDLETDRILRYKWEESDPWTEYYYAGATEEEARAVTW